MATPEGEFPKAGNDPMFNSEYNGFIRGLGSIGPGSRIGGGTDSIGGSVVIPANTISDSIYVFAQCRVVADTAGASATKIFTANMNGSAIGTSRLSTNTTTNINHNAGALIASFTSGAFVGESVVQVNINDAALIDGFTDKVLVFGN